MEIKVYKGDRKKYLSLLLLGDEEEAMIDRYIGRGVMYVLSDDGGVRGECIVTDEGDGILEIKNIAIEEKSQKKGYGKALLDFITLRYSGKYSFLQVGTGDSPKTVPFYEKCGFVRSHYIKDFFTQNYSHPIYEDGVQLIDMVYLRKRL